MKVIILFFAIFLVYLNSFSQTDKDMEKLEANYQKCLDRGVNMYRCSVIFYNNMDSLLNLVYKQIITKASVDERKQIRSEQRKWLSERDTVFRKFKKEVKKEGNDLDKRMIVMDKQATYVKKRVIELIKKRTNINYTKSPNAGRSV